MPVMDISVAADSGWRPLDEPRVTELMQAFRQGEFGLGILVMPSVLCHAGVPKVSVHDGRRRVNNGKSTVCALQRLQQEAAGGEPEWLTGQLADILQNGLRVDEVEYGDDSMDLVEAWNGLAHDVESNKWRATTIQMKIRIVQTARSRVAGGDWAATVKRLTDVYGASKRATIYRWVSAARGLDSDVLLFLSSRQDLLQGYVMENKYLCGVGADARHKLSPPFAVASLKLLFDALDAGRAVTVVEYAQEFCAPVKMVESWAAGIEKSTARSQRTSWRSSG